jgi:hypothetical protein
MDLEKQIRDLVERKAGGSASLTPSWEKALRPLRRLPFRELPPEPAFFRSPQNAGLFLQQLEQTPDPVSALRELREAVDNSEASAHDWIQAVEAFYDYLHGHRRTPSWSGTLGYLDCCLSAWRSDAGYGGFPETVAGMLETYGYAGEDEA